MIALHVALVVAGFITCAVCVAWLAVVVVNTLNDNR